MKPLKLFVVVLCVLLGLGHAADLAYGMDAATGFCTAGSVWWRYIALGVVVLAAVLAGRTDPLQAEPLRSRRPAAGVLAFTAAVCMIAAGAAQFAFAAGTVSTLVRILLEVLCAVWLSTLGRCWCSRGPWKTPAGGLSLAVAGSVLFYWNVLLRFMENSSSWHRVRRLRSGRNWRHCCSWPHWPGRCMCRSRKMAELCTQPGWRHLRCVCAGNCRRCCTPQCAMACARRCCRIFLQGLRCAASAAWALPAPVHQKMKRTDKNLSTPLVQLPKSGAEGWPKSYKSKKRWICVVNFLADT